MKKIKARFGRRLRFLRHLENLTQAVLAEQLGITEEYLGKIERGVSSPSFDLICRMAEALHTEVANLFLVADQDSTGEQTEDSQWSGMDWTHHHLLAGFWRYDPAQDRFSFSDSLSQVFGVDLSDAAADLDFFFTLVHEEDRDRLGSLWSRFLGGQYTGPMTFRFQHTKIGPRMGVLLGEVEWDQHGASCSAHGVLLDITEQKRFESSLIATQHKMEERVAERTHELARALQLLRIEAAERQQSERTKQHLDAIVQSSSQPMALLDREFVCLVANQANDIYFSLPDQGCPGLHIKDIIGEEAFEEHFLPMARLALDGRHSERRVWWQTPAGRKVCLDVRMEPFHGPDGRVQGVSLVSADVTDHEHDREQAERLAGLLRSVSDNMPDLLWAKDTEGRFLFANQTICDVLLKAEDTQEPVGRTDLFFAERERAAGHEHTFGEICVDSDAVVLENLRPGRFLEDGLVRGEYLALEVHKAPLYNAAGELIGTVGAGRDVTGHLARQKALAESEERYRLLAENVSDMIWVRDKNLHPVYFSPSVERLLGMTPEEAIGQDLFERCAPEDQAELERLIAVVRKAVATGDVDALNLCFELGLMRKDGQRVQTEISTRAVTDEQGQIVQLVGITRDITDRKRAEHYRHDVERLLRHEMRTPAQAAVVVAQALAANGRLTGQDLELVVELERLGRRLLDTLDLYVEMSRLEAGGYIPHGVNTDLYHLVQGAFHEVEWLARKRGVNMFLEDGDGQSLHVVAEQRLLRLALVNLVRNAVEASPEGGEVRAACKRDDGYCCVTLTNDGGVPEPVRDRLFEKYATYGKHNGQGLGGYLSRLVAQAHGGDLCALCLDQDRTEVRLTLPTESVNQ